MFEEVKVVEIPNDLPIDEKNLSFNHMILNGDVVQTCTMYIQNIREQLGKKVICPKCGRQFEVVKQQIGGTPK
jgi:hypothetical protein